MEATPREIREARAFLQNRGIGTGEIPPKQFANTAKRLGKSFAELLRQIAIYQLGGQGVGQTPVADEFATNKRQSINM